MSGVFLVCAKCHLHPLYTFFVALQEKLSDSDNETDIDQIDLVDLNMTHKIYVGRYSDDKTVINLLNLLPEFED